MSLYGCDFELEDGLTGLNFIAYSTGDFESPVIRSGIFIADSYCFITLYKEDLNVDGRTDTPPVIGGSSVIFHMAVYIKRGSLEHDVRASDLSDTSEREVVL